MRSELISANLSALPCVFSSDSRRVLVSCGSHVFTHSVKTGKLIESSESIMAKPSSMVLHKSELIISNTDGSKSILLNSKEDSAQKKVGSFQVVCVSDNFALVVSQSSEKGQVTLSIAEGDLQGSPTLTHVFTGVLGPVACSKSCVAVIVGADHKSLVLYDIALKSKTHFTHNKTYTSLAVHPCKDEVACGDASGRILRYSASVPATYTTAHHWHAVPVASLCYTSNGSVLLSGAEEGVLCLWNESSSDSKPQFVPRLGGPIAHLSLSRCNQFVAVSLKTNRIMIVDLFTRMVHSTISGTLHDGESVRGATVTPVDGGVIAVSTSSNVQLFDVHSRKSITKLPYIPLQERNYIPSTIRSRLQAEPWECKHVTVLAQESKWYLLSVLRRSKSRNEMVKIFESKDSGSTWSLSTVCVGPHADSITAVASVGVASSFLTASKDGSVNVWQQVQNSTWKITNSLRFKNQIPNHLSVEKDTGLIVAGFGQFVTLWHPTTLVELTKGSIHVEGGNVVFAGLVEKSTNLYTLSENMTVVVWDLKSCTPIAQQSITTTPTTCSRVQACVVGDRLLVSYSLDKKSVSSELKSFRLNSNKKRSSLEVEVIGTQSADLISQLLSVGGSLLMTSASLEMYRLCFGDNTEAISDDCAKVDVAMGEGADEEDVEVSTDDGQGEGVTEGVTGEERKKLVGRRGLVPLSAVVAKIDFAVHTSAEDQFFQLVQFLAPTTTKRGR